MKMEHVLRAGRRYRGLDVAVGDQARGGVVARIEVEDA
jgi:hypothetical protein